MTIAASGTLTSDGTEQTLATETVAGFYVLTVDGDDQVDGDSVIVRVKTRALTGGVTQTIYHGRMHDLLGEDKLIQSFPVMSNFELISTLEREAGAAADYPWSLERVS